MAAVQQKRNHNKEHLCVSCGEVKKKFHPHVMSCRQASKEEASDMLSAENHRVDLLRKRCFPIEVLEAKYGRQWPIAAHALVSVSIPVKIGNKKAVSSLTELQRYCCSKPHLGSFVGGSDGTVSFQWSRDQINEPEYLALPLKQVNDSVAEPPTQEAFVTPQVIKAHLPVIGQNPPEFNENKQVNSRKENSNKTDITNDGRAPTDGFQCVSTNVQVHMNKIRKRKRAISSSAFETSPSPLQVNKKLPFGSRTITTRSKTPKFLFRDRVQTKSYQESEEDGYFNVDDDVHDPTYSPSTSESGLRARRASLMKTHAMRYSDSESSSESESDLEFEYNVRKSELKQRMKESGLSLSKSDMERAMQYNPFLLEYKSWIALYHFSAKHEESSIKNIAKTMKFFSEGQNIDNFKPLDLLNIKKRDDFYETLSTLGIETKTISSYCTALEKMISCESVKAVHSLEIKSCFVDAEKLCKFKKKGLQNKMKHDRQDRLAELENEQVDSSQVLRNLLSAYTHLKRKSNKILSSIPGGYLPSASDVRLVNTFFYVHFISKSGQRPSAFSRMPACEIKNANKRTKLTDKNGASYRYLSTTDHKTGKSFISRVPFYDEEWQILTKYFKYMRPVPADNENARYLFLNSNGKILTSPPADLIDILKQEGLPHFTSTNARHAIETMSNDHLKPEEQGDVCLVLSHSLKTAKRNYVDSTKNMFQKGVNNIQTLFDIAQSPDKAGASISGSAMNNHRLGSSEFSTNPSGYEKTFTWQ